MFKKMMRALVAVLIAGLWASPSLWAKRYAIDPVHSSVSFKVRHLVISKVQGTFDRFSGEFFYDEKNPAAWKATAMIETASINTANEKRDGHLRAGDFLDAVKFSTITFQSTKVTDWKGKKAKLHGNLTIRDITKPVVLDLEIGGTVKAWGKQIAGFEATTKINRKDFGVAFHQVLETGGLMVDDWVEITLQIEGVYEEKSGEKAPEKK